MIMLVVSESVLVLCVCSCAGSVLVFLLWSYISVGNKKGHVYYVQQDNNVDLMQYYIHASQYRYCFGIILFHWSTSNFSTAMPVKIINNCYKNQVPVAVWFGYVHCIIAAFMVSITVGTCV